MPYTNYIGPTISGGKISPRLNTINDLITVDDIPVTKHSLTLLNKSFDVDKITLNTTGSAGVKELKHMSIYTVNINAATGFDLSGITLQAPITKIIGGDTISGVTTARIKLYIPTSATVGPQVWPSDLYWMIEYDHAAPTLTPGYCFFVNLEYDGTKTCANISHYYPLS